MMYYHFILTNSRHRTTLMTPIYILTALMTLTEIPPLSAADPIPQLIQIQSSAVRTAWREINRIISDNERLPQPSADPYLVRAELWVVAGSHEDALRDYLTATNLLFRDHPNAAQQSAHLARLRRALDQLLKQPRPAFPDSADREFARGTTAFHQHRLEEAAWSFEEACRLDPDNPLPHLYRGLVYRLQRRQSDADREIAVTVGLIRRPGMNVPYEMAHLHARLEPIQGPLRQWLNASLARSHK